MLIGQRLRKFPPTVGDRPSTVKLMPIPECGATIHRAFIRRDFQSVTRFQDRGDIYAASRFRRVECAYDKPFLDIAKTGFKW